MTYQSLEKTFNDGIQKIEASLPRLFTSADFIRVVKDYYPIEYAEAVRKASNYRSLHTWIARWYLSRRYAKHSTKKVVSPMGKESANTLWEK